MNYALQLQPIALPEQIPDLQKQYWFCGCHRRMTDIYQFSLRKIACPSPERAHHFFKAGGHVVQVFRFGNEDKIVYSAVEKWSMAEDALMTGRPFCNRGYNLFSISVCPLFLFHF